MKINTIIIDDDAEWREILSQLVAIPLIQLEGGMIQQWQHDRPKLHAYGDDCQIGRKAQSKAHCSLSGFVMRFDNKNCLNRHYLYQL
jgi:hypothetical protein